MLATRSCAPVVAAAAFDTTDRERTRHVADLGHAKTPPIPRHGSCKLVVANVVLPSCILWYLILYFFRARRTKGRLYLVTVYHKSAKDNLTKAERNEMKRLTAALDGEA